MTPHGLLDRSARLLLPLAIVRLREWRARFRRVGFAGISAWLAAGSSRMRAALVHSRIELLPSSLRRRRLSYVVDVGANEGQWLGALLRLARVDRVDAFEPNPAVYDILAARFSKHPSVSLHRLALGDQAGTAELHVTAAGDLSSLLRPHGRLVELYGADAKVAKVVTVPVARLDDVVPVSQTVDLLKLDAQGSEERVLAGGRATLKRTSVVLIEVNWQTHYEGEAGFATLNSMLCEGFGMQLWNLSDPARGPDARATWADLVYVAARRSPWDGAPECG